MSSSTSIELLEWQGDDEVRIAVDCSKGTYIRTLAEDIGELARVRCTLDRAAPHTHRQRFTLEGAVTLQAMENVASGGCP